MKISNFCVAIARYSTQKYKCKVKNFESNTWTEINASKWLLRNTNFTQIAHFCRPLQRFFLRTSTVGPPRQNPASHWKYFNISAPSVRPVQPVMCSARVLKWQLVLREARVPHSVPAPSMISDVYKPNKLCKAECVMNLVKCIHKLWVI